MFCAGFVVLHTINGGHAHAPMCDRTCLFTEKNCIGIHAFSDFISNHVFNHEDTLQTFA